MIFVLVQLDVIDETIFSEQILQNKKICAKQQADLKSLQFIVTINSIIIIINQLSYYSLMTSIYYFHWVNGKLPKM